jgi:hypothetical protein
MIAEVILQVIINHIQPFVITNGTTAPQEHVAIISGHSFVNKT